MNPDIKDILANSNKDIDNQQLMDYLSQQLSKADNHAVEKMMAEDEFMNDAVEGLQIIESQNNVQGYVEQLNNDLHKQIAKNRLRKIKRGLKTQPHTYFTILLILILLIISFLMIKKRLDSKHSGANVTYQQSLFLNDPLTSV